MLKRITKIAVISAMAALAAFAIAGCSPSPSDTVAKMLEAVKSRDSEALASVLSADAAADALFGLSEEKDAEMSATAKAACEAFAAKACDFDYKITGEAVNGDTATVTVEFTTYDIGTALKSAAANFLVKAFALAFSGADTSDAQDIFYADLMTQVDALTDKTLTRTADITLTKENGSWKVDPVSSGTVDAIFGGLESGTEALSKLGS